MMNPKMKRTVLQVYVAVFFKEYESSTLLTCPNCSTEETPTDKKPPRDKVVGPKRGIQGDESVKNGNNSLGHSSVWQERRK